MILSGGAHSSHTGRRNTLWFLLEVIGGWLGTKLGVLCFISHTILGTIINNFCGISFSSAFIYINWTVFVGGWPCSGAPFKMCLPLGSHLPPSKLQALILLLPSCSLLAFSLADAPSLPGIGCTSSVCLGHHPVRVISKQEWMGFFQLSLVSLGVMRGDPQ